MRRILLSFVCCVVMLTAIETWLHRHLFEHVSYTNSEHIDNQLKARDAGKWDMIFIGDSEVHWGIDPREVDAAFARAGQPMRSFNHAFDGFGASWWPRLLPALLNTPALRQTEIVAVGIQLTDLLGVVSEKSKSCGALQRPVLTSPFAIDLGVDGLCRDRSWDAELGRQVFGGLWSVRYASSVHTLLLPTGFGPPLLHMNSRSLGAPVQGFQPHRSIAQDRETYSEEFQRWKAQFDPQRDLQPLPKDSWNALVADGGFFDQLYAPVRASGRRLVLFALPTNPVVIDTFHRRADYARNSLLLNNWATRHGIVFVDLGIQDRPDADTFFSDMRHLSYIGARIYSGQLGAALAQLGIGETQ